MKDFASLAPGAVTGGGVEIGFRSAVGIGTAIKQRVVIGDDAVVGAKSYLNQNLPSGVVAYGSPARIIRTRSPGAPYLN
jgi:acetyltransferase-like isoleucine patch superfamily enzyme